MLQTMPRITVECILAQSELSNRLPPHLYVDDMLGFLKEHNPAIYDVMLIFGGKIDEEMEGLPEKAWIKFHALRTVGFIYSAVQAQIEGDYLDHQYGVILDAKPDEETPDDPKRQPGKSNDDEKPKK